MWTSRKYVSSHYHILWYQKTGLLITPENLGSFGSVWKINREYKTGKVRNKNQLPEALLERLIDLGTTENDIVADFFLGSFSTARTAIKMGRRATGFEINKEAFDYWNPITIKMTSLNNNTKIYPQGSIISNRLLHSRPLQDFPEKNNIDLFISWPNEYISTEWMNTVYNHINKNGSVYIITTVANLCMSLRVIKDSKFNIVNHIIWVTCNGSTAIEETHNHILYIAPNVKTRIFNMEAIVSKSARLPSGGSANYADREDVWWDMTWDKVIEKIVKYSSNTGNLVASFCSESQEIKNVVISLRRQFVEK